MTSYSQQLLADLVTLCHANSSELAAWLDKDSEKIKSCLIWLVLGSSLYGASIGLWRAPLQGLYVAIKFPLLVILTTLGNAVINGMLAQLLGAKISFRQSFLAILMSFSLIAIILGSLTPLTLFLLHNLPPIGSELQKQAHALILLTNVALIAFAGVIGNLHLFSLLKHICNDVPKAKQILFTWLGVNMFLGSQLSWNLRPFFGTPSLEVRFLRDDPFNGSFYETIFRMIKNFLF